LIRIGPAGWSYADWKGPVYPKPQPRDFDPIDFLSEWFDTIEINSTFYRPATKATAKQWAERVSHRPDFQFTAKLWRRFTHERQSAWTPKERKQVDQTFEPLLEADRLGAVVVQFPWSFRNDEAGNAWLYDLLQAFRLLPLAVELRHASWDSPDVYAMLEEHGVAFVNIDQPRFRSSIAPSSHVTSKTAYVRLHGRNYQDWFRKTATALERYDYLYSAEELEPWVRRIETLAEDERTRDVYVITNNHVEGKALANGLMLESMLDGRPVPMPPSLLKTYRKELAPFAAKPRGRDADAHA
jgi:uncharacterized protein YecE (DUF72 family)